MWWSKNTKSCISIGNRSASATRKDDKRTPKSSAAVHMKPESKERPFKKRRLNLSHEDIQRIYEAAVDLLRRCMKEPMFLFWLDWVLRLEDPSPHRETAPGDEATWNFKEWSHVTTSTCLGIGLDASNIAFYHQGVVLTCSLGQIPGQWSSSYLARYQFPS